MKWKPENTSGIKKSSSFWPQHKGLLKPLGSGWIKWALNFRASPLFFWANLTPVINIQMVSHSAQYLAWNRPLVQFDELLGNSQESKELYPEQKKFLNLSCLVTSIDATNRVSWDQTYEAWAIWIVPEICSLLYKYHLFKRHFTQLPPHHAESNLIENLLCIQSRSTVSSQIHADG